MVKLKSGKYIFKLLDSKFIFYCVVEVNKVAEIKDKTLPKNTKIFDNFEEVKVIQTKNDIILKYSIPFSEKKNLINNDYTIQNIGDEYLEEFYYFDLKELNPPIWLYHTTKLFKLRSILRDGLSTQSIVSESEGTEGLIEELIRRGEIKDEEEYWDNWESENSTSEEKARWDLNDELEGHDNCIFFVKETGDIHTPSSPSWKEARVIKVRADKIPCRCLEANNDLSDRIFELLIRSYDESSSMRSEEEEEELYNAIDDYNKNIKTLDIRKKDYLVEVMCPCDIPAKEIILDLYPIYPEAEILNFTNWVKPKKKDIVENLEKIKSNTYSLYDDIFYGNSIELDDILNNLNRGKIIDLTPEFDYLIKGRSRMASLISLGYHLRMRPYEAKEYYVEGRDSEQIILEIYNKFKNNSPILMPLIADIRGDYFQLLYGDLIISMAYLHHIYPKVYLIEVK